MLMYESSKQTQITNPRIAYVAALDSSLCTVQNILR